MSADVQVEDVLLAEPRGFCAGVDRAIEIVERALTKFGAPIYVRHEIVHNTYVVNDLKTKGAIFIEDLADVPPGATLAQLIDDPATAAWTPQGTSVVCSIGLGLADLLASGRLPSLGELPEKARNRAILAIVGRAVSPGAQG